MREEKYVGLQVSILYCYQIKENGTGRQIAVKLPGIRFHENPLSGYRVVVCAQIDGQTHGEANRIIIESIRC
jgi:hypothetical protein